MTLALIFSIPSLPTSMPISLPSLQTQQMFHFLFKLVLSLSSEFLSSQWPHYFILFHFFTTNFSVYWINYISIYSFLHIILKHIPPQPPLPRPQPPTALNLDPPLATSAWSNRMLLVKPYTLKTVPS